MPRPRKYPDELRERAVQLVFDCGRPIARVAKDLGVHREALGQWVRQAEADAGTGNERLTSAERERLKELQREVRELRKANEILKAASVFSPRSSTRPDRGERVHRRASRGLRGRAHLSQHRDVGVGVLPARHGPAVRTRR
jgi:transposase